jgi:hypothetical protein
MAEATESIGRMIEREVGNCISHIVGGGEGEEFELLWQTYLEAFRQSGQAAVRLPNPDARYESRFRPWLISQPTAVGARTDSACQHTPPLG